MAFSKAPQFDSITFRQSIWSKALSHPARIMILSHLLEHGVTSFQTLAKQIPLAKTTVSQHLRFLRALSLIESFEKYPHTYYRLHHITCKNLAVMLGPLNTGFTSVIEETPYDQLPPG